MKIISKNKLAYLNYEIEETLEVGIILKGHEVKSIKSGQANIKDGIVKMTNGELRITNMNIPLYTKTSLATVGNYDPKGMRKLLVTKKQIGKRSGIISKGGGYTIVPLELYSDKNYRIKLKLGLGTLRKKIEKKQIIKERDIDREAKKEIKNISIIRN